MQDNKSGNKQKRKRNQSELRVEFIAGGLGEKDSYILVPPCAVVRAPGDTSPRKVDTRPLATEQMFDLPSVLPEDRWVLEDRRENVFFSLPFALENGVSDAIIHRELQRRQRDDCDFVRNKKRYLQGFSGQRIFDALDCFARRSIVYDTASRLARNGHLEPAYPDEVNYDAWYQHPLSYPFHVPAPMLHDNLMAISATDAKTYGLVKAVILAAYREKFYEKEEQRMRYKRLSAKELAVTLPYDAQTIGKHLRQLIGREVLEPHFESPKYYARVDRQSQSLR